MRDDIQWYIPSYYRATSHSKITIDTTNNGYSKYVGIMASLCKSHSEHLVRNGVHKKYIFENISLH